jgi:L-lactate dehydrogenase complex protein LldG
MQESKTREKVLKQIRRALLHRIPDPFPGLDFDSPAAATGDHPEIAFARRFTDAGGRFVFCETEEEAAEGLGALAEARQWHRWRVEGWPAASRIAAALPRTAAGRPHDAVLCGCLALVAEDGSVLLGDAAAAGKPLVVAGRAGQVAGTWKEALRQAGRHEAVTAVRPGAGGVGRDDLFLFLIDEPGTGAVGAGL